MCLLFAFQLASGSVLNFTKRAKPTDAPTYFRFQRAAVLVSDGQATSCEFALIDNKSAFVAATCLTDASGNQVKASYEIYFNNAAGLAKERALISNSKITIHPDFDPRTFANNIAVVRFTGISSNGWSSGVGISADEWNNRWFARSYLQDVQTMTWNEAVIETRLRQSSYCVQTSGIYAANTDSMFCTTATMSAVGGAQCDMPFSISYAVSLEKIVPAAIFSHTVYYGNQLCDSSRLLHYYTSLANYITFAESVIDRKINLVPNHPDYGYSTNPLFSMAGSAFDTVLGTGTFAGNLFLKSDPDTQVPVTEPTKDTEQDSAPPSKTASEPLSGAGSDSETKPATTAATGTTSNPASPIPAG
ncbi:hypothetical protein GGF37_006348, partial [Kickxella alabastrina]